MDQAAVRAGNEQSATEQELQAALGIFKAECIRGNGPRLNRATEAAHAALQAHLDAISSLYAIAKKLSGQ